MQIGTVAKKVGLSVDAIRFYERNALLPRAPRTEGGFRQYGEGDIETLGFIRRAQGLGSRSTRSGNSLRLERAGCSLVLPCAGGWNKSSPCASQAHGSSEAGTRTAFSAPQLQQGAA
jgi:DNA-binding transcriptional MerR regulator